MKVLVVGSGAREHALVWKIAQSPSVDKIYCAPGNAGTAQLAESIEIKAEDIPGLKRFAQANKVDLTVVGPEAPLAAGIVDEFQIKRLQIFGPTKAAAQLEASKIYAKRLMYKYRIPTAKWNAFVSAREAKEYVKRQVFPQVVKANGLGENQIGRAHV